MEYVNLETVDSYYSDPVRPLRCARMYERKSDPYSINAVVSPEIEVSAYSCKVT